MAPASTPTPSDPIRVLALGDTHLGFDSPRRPRRDGPGRGQAFFDAYLRALAPAFAGQVDLVIHLGDLLYRSRVPAGLQGQALAPLLALARAGLPVCLIPGNHERSSLPYPLLDRHPDLHVFLGPACVRLRVRGSILAVAGFPFQRGGIRDSFDQLLDRTGMLEADSQARLLCLHEAVEGARVAGFTFPAGRRDVVRGQALPSQVAAVLSGHIHRHQQLTRDLAGRPLPAQVLYPGATERTSWAERSEAKGCLHLSLGPGPTPAGRLLAWRFEVLSAPVAAGGPARVLSLRSPRVGGGPGERAPTRAGDG
jgi:DNA repair protein SbcD/Mre11